MYIIIYEGAGPQVKRTERAPCRIYPYIIYILLYIYIENRRRRFRALSSSSPDRRVSRLLL